MILASPCYANSLKGGLGASRVFLLGDLADYFQDGFALGGDLQYEWTANSLGKVYLASSFEALKLTSDDVRESSSLQLYSLSGGVTQQVYGINWYDLNLTLQPRLTFWNLKNNLSSFYKRESSGTWLGALMGLVQSFHLGNGLSLDSFLLADAPELAFVNTYLNVGLRFAKTW